MGERKPRAFATLPVDHEELSLVGAYQKVLLVDAAEGAKAFGAVDGLLMFYFP
jgi:hypothetical protein